MPKSSSANKSKEQSKSTQRSQSSATAVSTSKQKSSASVSVPAASSATAENNSNTKQSKSTVIPAKNPRIVKQSHIKYKPHSAKQDQDNEEDHSPPHPHIYTEVKQHQIRNAIPSEDEQTFHHTLPTDNIENELPEHYTMPTNHIPSRDEIHNPFDDIDHMHDTGLTHDIPSHEEIHNVFDNTELAADHLHNTIPTNNMPTNIVSHVAIPGKVGGTCVASGQLQNGQHIIKGFVKIITNVVKV